MIRLVLGALAVLLVIAAAQAQISPPQIIILFGKTTSASGSNPGSSVLLINTGSAFLINTGSRLLIQ